MPVQKTAAGYEFDREQNAVFSRLAGSMKFVGLAILISGGLLFSPAYRLFRPGAGAYVELGLLAVLGVVLVVMGANLYGAANHFKRIATTEGSDISNLMVAMKELAAVYALQRWLWIAIVIAAIISFIGTTGAR
jgi:hypothetical protein